MVSEPFLRLVASPVASVTFTWTVLARRFFAFVNTFVADPGTQACRLRIGVVTHWFAGKGSSMLLGE